MQKNLWGKSWPTVAARKIGAAAERTNMKISHNLAAAARVLETEMADLGYCNKKSFTAAQKRIGSLDCITCCSEKPLTTARYHDIKRMFQFFISKSLSL